METAYCYESSKSPGNSCRIEAAEAGDAAVGPLFVIRWLRSWIQLLATYGAEELGIWQPFGLDARVLTLSFGAVLLTGIVFGTLPALQTARVNVREALTLCCWELWVSTS